MSDRLFLATFGRMDDVRDATHAVRESGYSVVDVYAPHAIHGIDEAMGLRPSRLTWVCFVCGALGVLGMFCFEQWTAAISWPIDVGGKPWNSWPSDVPVAFEALVFMAAFGSVAAFLAVCRLFPGKRVRPVDPAVSDDRFVLVLAEGDARFDVSDIRGLLSEFNVLSTEERLANGETGR